MKIISKGLAKGKQKDAIICFQKGAFKEAMTILTKLVDSDATNIVNLKILASCLFIDERIREARSYLEEAKDNASMDPEVTNLLALTYLHEGNVQQAIAVILDAQELQNHVLLNTTLDKIRALKNPEYASSLPLVSMIQLTIPGIGFLESLKTNETVNKYLPICLPVLGILLFIVFYPNLRNIVTKMDIRNRSEISPATQVSIQGIKSIVDARENYRIVLDEKVIIRKFEELKMALSQQRYNRAKILVNELLASNASLALKERVTILEGFIEESNIDNIDYIPKYAEIAVAPAIYEGIMLRWTGTVANIHHQGRQKTTFDLLVNFVGQGLVEGMALVELEGLQEFNNGDKVSVIGPVIGMTEDNRVIMKGERVLH